MDITREFLRYYTPCFANGFIRTREASLIRGNEIRSPSLDIGCGDGSFVKIGLERKFDVGYDLSREMIRKARGSGAYRNLVVGNIKKFSFPDESFYTVLANSVLEHVDEISSTIKEIARILRRKGRLILTVPCSEYNNFFYRVAILNWFGIKRNYNYVHLQKYHLWLNHKNLLTEDDWVRLINDAKMKIRQRYYYTPAKTALFHSFFMDMQRLMFYPLLSSNYLTPMAILTKVLNRLPPIKWLYLKISEMLFANLYLRDVNDGQKGSHLFIVAEKT